MLDLKASVGSNFKNAEVVKTTHRELQERNQEAFEADETAQAAAEALATRVLDLIRVDQGAVFVHSWYRCPELNAVVGGQPASQHMKAEAADIEVAGYGDPEGLASMFEWVRKNPELFIAGDANSPIGQVILEGAPFSWIHVSLGRGYRLQSRCGEAFFTVRAGNKFRYVPVAPGDDLLALLAREGITL